jgi:hypothetical protein
MQCAAVALGTHRNAGFDACRVRWIAVSFSHSGVVNLLWGLFAPRRHCTKRCIRARTASSLPGKPHTD